MRNKLRRPLAFLLSAVMIVTMSGTPVHAVADRGQPETGLCEHHTAHTDDCGYTEETPGTPCGHEHTEDCYTEVTECVHEHTPECYRSETEDSVSGNEATPANAEKREPENCPHICDKESGCITEKLDCRHEHDSECGYTESTPGTPCTYVCEICNPKDSGEADKEPETGIIKQEQCSCLTLCTEGQTNPDCPVCGAEDTGLSDCKGKAAKEDAKQPEYTGICKHHQEHDDACGYQPESEDSEGSPCTYECRICPVEELIAALPDKVTEDNAEDIRGQLDQILALYRELTEDEQEQIGLSRCYALQEALDGANAPAPAEGHAEQQENDVASVTIDGTTTYVGNLDDAFKKENDSATITLLKDIERTGPLDIEINCTLNLGGHKISSSSGAYNIHIIEGANVIIEGEGEVISENSRALWVEGSATLEGGTFTSRYHNSPGVYVSGTNTTTTLSVTGKNVVIRNATGSGIGLKVWQAKSIQLSSGTYSGWRGIDLTSGFFTLDQLLGHSGDTRYAYFDKSGTTPFKGVLGNKSLTGTVTVGECMHDKSVCEYTPNEGAETHAMNCLACGLAEAAADCTYSDDYGHDETNHWQTCTLCGGKKTETHSWGYLWASTTSTIRRSCDKCEIGTAVGNVSVTPDFSVAYGETGSATLVCTAELADGYSLEPADSADNCWVLMAVSDGKSWNLGRELEVKLPADLPAGEYWYTASPRLSYQGNNTIVKRFNVLGTVTVIPAPLTVTGAAAADRAYDGTNSVQITGVTLDGILNGDDVSVDTTGLTGTLDGSNAGSYTNLTLPAMTLTGADAGNYTLTQPAGAVPASVTINKASAPTITWPAANDLTYGQKLSESTLSGGSTEYGSFAWAKSDTVPTAGTSGYSVTFTPSDSTVQNYEPITTTTQDVDVTVAQATPTVTVAVKMSDSANSRVADLIITVAGAQNGAAPAGSITLTSDGLSETLTLQNGKAAYKWENLSDKEYTVTAAYSGDTNYKAANGQLTFDAAKKEQTISIDPIEAKTYGDAAFTLTVKDGIGTGAVSFTSSDPSIISINGSTATIHKAGTVTITARKAADNNYNEAVAAISLTIGKRPITVTADSFTVVKGAAMPKLDYQAEGLVNNDTFTTDPTMTTSVSDTNTLGEYVIVISGGILQNGDSYQITYVNGKLTVTDKIPVQLTMTANPTSLSGKGTVTLTISGLPSGGEATVSCSDSSINVTGSGTGWKATLPNETATYTFTANYSGDSQHSSAVATCTVSVTKQTGGGSSGGGNGNSGGSGNGGGSSSGGGGSSSGDNASSGGGSTIVARPDETKPDTPTTSQTKPATPDKNGNVAVDNGTVQSAINTAKNDAKKNGNTANGVAVVIPVTPKEGQNSFNVTINAQTLNTLVSENVKRLEINIEGVVVGGMDTKLLKWLDTLSANGDVIFRVKQTDPSGLSKEAKAAIGTRPVYDLSLVYLSGGKETPITDFGGHTIAVRLPYAPAKEEQAGNLYAVYVDGKGKVEWLTRSSYDPDLGTVVFEAGHFSIYGIGYKNPAPDFTDIKNHWAADNIIFVASRGLLAGTGNNQFSPDTGMTRGMFVTALGRLAGIDQADYKTGKFTDVKADAYYAPYVNWAAEKGIVNGTTATTFSPDTNITREQMAVIMANYAKKLGYDLPAAHEAVTFADNAQISGWAAKEVKAMQQAGILAGKGGNRFDPKGTATRAEVATVLRRFVEIVIDPQTAQGWMQNHSGSWQYMKNGKPATGWLQDDKK